MYVATILTCYVAPLTTTVNCTDGELRLRGGGTNPRRGTVEMCYEGQWGTVCDNLWGTNDAKVACRQLGFSSYGILHCYISVTECMFTVMYICMVQVQLLTRVVTLDMELDPYCWTMWHVQEEN